MEYIVSGLPLAPFEPLFGLGDAALRAHGAVRIRADARPGFPCRITLEDAAPGESLLLLHWQHQPAATPYRSGGPIFVREGARATARVRNAIPPQQRERLLSVRGYDADGWMHDADVLEGTQLETAIERFFQDPRIACLHVHNARRGCYACRSDRA
ncbi:DUF1203 domain-containing protein [Thermomonas sp. XSG]|uniref:DUF1203 domain-containing protein n=1 Tax=Thermomonas sp. XSG TaxID=2771436 RepID=UPI001680D1F7|nr:DUF1203 domain-containing protein [Thermomonas sp. XSG]QNU15260.1 DUF1203 domain-containing protein [Thermomonas sp. XSG]